MYIRAVTGLTIIFLNYAGAQAADTARDNPPVATPTSAPSSAEKTVTLTREELDALLKSETTKAVANYLAQQEAGKAQGVYAKINKAFGAPSP